MNKIKEAEFHWKKKYRNFTDDLDGLVSFIENNMSVDSVVNAFDSLKMRSANPLLPLSNGSFIPENLKNSPKTSQPYILQIDTSVSFDTTINRRGANVKIDSILKFGSRYCLKDPDVYGTIGDLHHDALKNTTNWE